MGLFSRSITVDEIDRQMKPFMKKKVECEELMREVMTNRIAVKKSDLNEEDKRKMEAKFFELYDTFSLLPKKLQNNIIKHMYGAKKSEFTKNNFYNATKMAVFAQLIQEGKIKT